MDDLQALSRLHDLAMLSLGAAGREAFLGEVVDVAIEISNADCGNLLLVDSGSGDLQIVAQRGFPSGWMQSWNQAAKGHGVGGSAVEKGTRVIVEDLRSDPLSIGKPTLALQLEAGVRAVQTTPLLTRTGKALGAFSTHYRQPQRPDERVLRWLDLLARQAADMIENAQVASALRRSESRFRAMATASWDVLYCMSADWSQVCLLQGKGFVADAADASDDWLTRYIDPADRARVAEAVAEAMRTRQVFDLEHRVQRADGTQGWAHSRAIPLVGDDGEIIEWFGAAKDVSAAKRTEAELFAQRQRLDALLQSLPVGVAFSDSPDCAHVSGNAALLELLESKPGDNLSADAPEADAPGRQMVFLRQGRAASGLELPLQRAVREGRTIEPTEIEIRLPSGRRCLTEVSAAPIRDAQGEAIGAVAVIVDITERQRADEAREQARLKDEFLAVLGHELRNPLAAICSAMQALAPDMAASERVDIDGLIRRQVDVLRRLVDDLLDISRVTHGQIRLQMEDVALSELLNSAVAAVLPAAKERSQDLAVSLRPEQTWFVADKVRMQQIVANLLDNACKYTDRGGRIELSGAREGQEVVLRCKDNGCGIARPMQERIFEPLVRVESAGHTAAGLGLGLTLVKRLAMLHGGRVTVKSDGPGAGSEFIVRIPFVAPAHSLPGPDRAAAAESSARPASIFIVEDNPDVAQSLMLVLEQAGHRVSPFSDGPSALAAAEDSAPDVILLDIGLPGMNGHEVLARMRQRTHLQHTLLVGISGLPENSRAAAEGPRFDRYLVKPIDIDAVLAIVDEHTLRTQAMRTLLVEDHADLAAATAWLLRREGLDVAVASTGHEAIDAALRMQPQIILCDLNLPDMSGLEVIRELRHHFGAWGTHAAVVTGRSDDELRAYNQRAAGLGVDEFVSKPLTPAWVRSLMARLQRP